MGERNHMVVSFAGVVCDRMTSALSARRPSAGAMPGRCEACLAVRTAPAAFFHSSGSKTALHRVIRLGVKTSASSDAKCREHGDQDDGHADEEAEDGL